MRPCGLSELQQARRHASGLGVGVASAWAVLEGKELDDPTWILRRDDTTGKQAISMYVYLSWGLAHECAPSELSKEELFLKAFGRRTT